MAARDVGVAKHAFTLLRAADRCLRALEHVAAIPERDDRPRGHQTRLGAAPGPALARFALAHRRVDHRVALLALAGALTLALGRLDEAGLDAELAEPQPLVGLELDLGTGQQVIAAPPGVLE